MEANMSVEIRVPTLGESLVDAVIATWLKHEGDQVSQGEALVELETDKVNVEVTADESGVLQKILKQEGDTVAVGEVLGTIGEGASASTASAAKEGQKTPTGSLQAMQTSSDGQRPPSPLARRIAEEHAVDISQVRGTSPHGRVTKDDVINYMEQNTQKTAPSQRIIIEPEKVSQQAQAATPPVSAPVQPAVMPQAIVRGGREERVRLSRRRQTIAQRLVEAQHNAAMLTTFNEIDMSAVMEVRTRRKDSFKERYGVGLGFMSFFTKASIGALKAYPRLNAEIQGTDIILKKYYDIGVAVS